MDAILDIDTPLFFTKYSILSLLYKLHTASHSSPTCQTVPLVPAAAAEARESIAVVGPPLASSSTLGAGNGSSSGSGSAYDANNDFNHADTHSSHNTPAVGVTATVHAGLAASLAKYRSVSASASAASQLHQNRKKKQRR